MDRYLEKATISYIRSLEGSKKGAKDDVFLDYACYDMQQAVELYLKSKLIDAGIVPKHTHEIIELIDDIKQNNIKVPYIDELYNFSETLSSWEAKGRYTTEYLKSSQKLKAIHKIFNNIFEQDFPQRCHELFKKNFNLVQPKQKSVADRAKAVAKSVSTNPKNHPSKDDR